MEFVSPGTISYTRFGRDKLDLKMLDKSKFISSETMKPLTNDDKMKVPLKPPIADRESYEMLMNISNVTCGLMIFGCVAFTIFAMFFDCNMTIFWSMVRAS